MAAEILANPVLRLRRVVSDEVLPSAVDVVVIGGGLVGASAAWHLARAGLKVALCEKGAIGAEQSGRNWGWCRNTLRHPTEIPLMIQSMRDWRDPAAFGGLDTGFRTTGIAYLCGRTTDDEQAYLRWLDAVKPFGLDSHMLLARELDKVVPGSAQQPSAALFTPSDGCAEPEKATAAIAEAARTLGAVLLTNCAVRTVELQAGKVGAAVTEKGRIGCGAVLLAGGTWSRRFAGNLGIDLPQLQVMGSVMYTAPMPGGPDVSVAGRGFGWRRREDGGYIVSQADATIFDIVGDSFRLLADFRPALLSGLKTLRLRVGRRFIEEARLARRWRSDETTPFEQVRIAEPEPAGWVLDEAVHRIGAAYPFFSNVTVLGRWGGFIDVTPDALPVIGPVPQLPGLHMATGMSGHGFGLGPGAGRLAAQMITGNKPCVDPAPFRLHRFPRARTIAGH